MPWPPRVRDPLPRAADAWYEQPKLAWILGAEGHGLEWQRIFRIDLADRELFWRVIARAARASTISDVRDRSPHGLACEITPKLVLNRRSSFVIVSWHYSFEGAAPRLVTAYPTT